MNANEQIIDVTGSLNDLKGKLISLRGKIFRAEGWKWKRRYGTNCLQISIFLNEATVEARDDSCPLTPDQQELVRWRDVAFSSKWPKPLFPWESK